MVPDTETSLGRTMRSVKDSQIGRLFWDKRFFSYTWIGVFISLLNIFLLWLFIDILDVPTVIASVIVIGSTFIIRYILYVIFKML